MVTALLAVVIHHSHRPLEDWGPKFLLPVSFRRTWCIQNSWLKLLCLINGPPFDLAPVPLLRRWERERPTVGETVDLLSPSFLPLN
ncbi:hypothetical protein V5799_000774 [Amblyomma americanum]|uniref:Uncharacterized protein n=1 Tax=Amblyomma americanum TaxID=6943 RepID=A0AAQ4D234_AMBAM